MGEDDACACFMTDVFATMKKRGKKEVSLRGMTDAQKRVFTQCQSSEFQKILDRKAATVIGPSDAVQIRLQKSHRIMGSRFVNTEEPSVEAVDGIKRKSRWCVLGDQDPDVLRLAASNATASPTVSMCGRAVSLQLAASFGWHYQIGDVDGAFLNSDLLSESSPERISAGGLYCELPAGGIPGIAPGSLIRIDRSVYGLGDAPMKWWQKVQRTMLAGGWRQSVLDPCLFTVFNDDGSIAGVACWHVDDVLCAGSGKVYETAREYFRKHLPFRKWREDHGTFCGTEILRNNETGEISLGQHQYAEDLQAMSKTKAGMHEFLTAQEVSSLRTCNGSVGWLAYQSRPDLSVQVSMAQQGVPRATGRHHAIAQQAVRRAKQFSDLKIVFRAISPDSLRVCVHSDAAFERNDEGKPQYGFIVGFCEEAMTQNQSSWWTPALWRSSRVKRACSSTLAAEAQAALDGVRHAEWLTALLSECLYQEFDLEERESFLCGRMAAAITDCKSLYDHCHKEGSAGTLSDKSGALDVVQLKQSLTRLNLPLRWAPTKVQLADGLTKSDADALDYLRATMRSGRYELCDEEKTMTMRAEEKARRVSRGEAKRKAAEERQKQTSGTSQSSRGGKRDYWLPSDTKHYLGKLIRNSLVSQKVVRIRVHQNPRSSPFGWGEVPGFPTGKVSSQRLSLVRKVLSDGGVGPIIQHWDRWGDSSEVFSGSWIGATVVLEDEE